MSIETPAAPLRLTPLAEGIGITFALAHDPKAKKNVKEAIRSLIVIHKVWEGLKPYITNGGKSGHKMMDMTHAVIVLRDHDDAKGGAIASFGLNDFQLANALKQVLRERLELDRSWKVVGEKQRLTA